MAAAYPTDYPFNVDHEGWPESVYTPPYPHEYYYDNGQNLNEIKLTTDRTLQYTSRFNNGHHQQQPNSNGVVPLAIRRHTPGSTDPTLQQTSSRHVSQTANVQVTVKKKPSQPKSYSTSVRNHSSVSIDPDERPIKPMKNTSVYNKPPATTKITQPKKPLSPPKPIQSPSRFESNSSQSSPKSRQSPFRYESDSFQPTPPPPSRTQMNNFSPRRPIRIDLIPKTPFGIPTQRIRSRPIIVEEYYDDDDPVTYVEPIPEQIISYREVPVMTTREMENYQMSKPRRIVRVRSPPVETIIYRT